MLFILIPRFPQCANIKARFEDNDIFTDDGIHSGHEQDVKFGECFSFFAVPSSRCLIFDVI